MTRGNAKSNKWAIVLNPPKNEATKEVLSGYVIKVLNHYQSFLASIIHDKDIEDGKQKTIHCHLFLTTAMMSKTELLNDLVELLEADKSQISIEATNSDILQVQYLVHKNDLNKYQYSEADITTNDKEELLKRLNEAYKSPEEREAELIEDLSSMDLRGVVRKYGLEIGRRYLSLSKEMKDEKSKEQAYINLKADYSRLERRFNRLYDLAHKLILDAGKCLLDNQKNIISFNAKLSAIEDLFKSEIDADLEEISDLF